MYSPECSIDLDGMERSLFIGTALVLFCLVMAAVGRGMGDTYAIFLLPLSQDLGWDRSNIASIYAVYIGAMGVFSPLSGYLFDRFGSRFIYVFGVLCLGGILGCGKLNFPMAFLFSAWTFNWFGCIPDLASSSSESRK